MSWHRHVGVYGICCIDNQLLVVHKTGGPYRNRFDLPGGGINPQETIVHALHREFEEEAGLAIEVGNQIGVGEYVVRYPIREHSHIQHLAIFYETTSKAGYFTKVDRISDDAAGAEWIHLTELNEENSSPLVMSAKLCLMNRTADAFMSRTLDDWQVRVTPSSER